MPSIATTFFTPLACELGTSREELVLALRDEKTLDAFAAEHQIARADAERALRVVNARFGLDGAAVG